MRGVRRGGGGRDATLANVPTISTLMAPKATAAQQVVLLVLLDAALVGSPGQGTMRQQRVARLTAERAKFRPLSRLGAWASQPLPHGRRTPAAIAPPRSRAFQTLLAGVCSGYA